ncbi:MAG: dehydrogenase [Alphaproteobacteria bacterium]|nr:dehydrogenase [Alphaproteobacteria bacterium]
MDQHRMQVVASGDYLHTRGSDSLETLGFDAYARVASRIAVTPLSAGPQTAAVAPDDLAAADALLMLGQFLPAASIAPAARRLLVVARAGVGVDKIDVEACTAHGVLLFNVPDALTEGTAAGALALMLATSRQLVALDRLTREGRWDDRQFHRGREIYGKTLGVIGPGRIGGELIRLVAPFRMRVLAYSPRLTPARAEAIGAQCASLDSLLDESDFVAVCCPLSEETRGMLGARELARLKTTAFLVNVGRGPVIDQDALVAALRARSFAGAGLDVFSTQPMTADDPLAALDNVVLCPHAVCDTYELRRDVLAVTAVELLALTEGGLPKNILNPAVLDSPLFQAKRSALVARVAGRPSA